MAIDVLFKVDGVTRSVPEKGEVGWQDVTNIFVALGNATSAAAAQSATNGAFSSAALVPSGTVPLAANLQSATVSLAGGNSYLISVGLDTGQSMYLTASFLLAAVSAVSDLSGIFLPTDAGIGIVVTKSASSATLTFKNRMGGNRNIDVRLLTNTITSATVWS